VIKQRDVHESGSLAHGGQYHLSIEAIVDRNVGGQSIEDALLRLAGLDRGDKVRFLLAPSRQLWPYHSRR
jgi:hypothetical protein